MKLSIIASIVGFASLTAAAPPDPVDTKRWIHFFLVAQLIDFSGTTKYQPVSLYSKSPGKVILAVGNTKTSPIRWAGENPAGGRVFIKDSKEQQLILTPSSSFTPKNPFFDVVVMDQAEATAAELRNSKHFMFDRVQFLIDTLRFGTDSFFWHRCFLGDDVWSIDSGSGALPDCKQQDRVHLHLSF